MVDHITCHIHTKVPGEISVSRFMGTLVDLNIPCSPDVMDRVLGRIFLENSDQLVTMDLDLLVVLVSGKKY